jgi:hypothetical protein
VVLKKRAAGTIEIENYKEGSRRMSQGGPEGWAKEEPRRARRMGQGGTRMVGQGGTGRVGQ